MHASVHVTDVFTMLVIVAVLTTVMTGLLLPRAGHVIPVGVDV
jgi:hypothetical protein